MEEAEKPSVGDWGFSAGAGASAGGEVVEEGDKAVVGDVREKDGRA